MNKKNKFAAAVIALLLVAVTIIGIGFNGNPIDSESVRPNDAAANGKSWTETLNKYKHGSGSNFNSGSGSKSKYDYTYADGSTSNNYVELVKADTNKRFTVTLVKSGVTNKQTGTTKKSNNCGTIDWTHANEGWVTLKWTKSTNKKVKGAVDYTDKNGKVTYFDWYMEKDKSYDIPVYYGSGKYTVTLFENTTGTKYAAKLVVTVNAKLNSEFGPFLHSTKDANFSAAPNAVAKAKELTAKCKTDREKINIIYNWVYGNIKYDSAMANENGKSSQQYTIYDLDKILKDRKGVCGDRAALMAGMLRSLGIPCKIAVSDNHGWISVWNETSTQTKNGITYSTGAWVTLDSTSKSTHAQADERIKYYG